MNFLGPHGLTRPLRWSQRSPNSVSFKPWDVGGDPRSETSRKEFGIVGRLQEFLQTLDGVQIGWPGCHCRPKVLPAFR